MFMMSKILCSLIKHFNQLDPLDTMGRMLLCVAEIKLLMIILRNVQIVVDHNNAYWVPHVLIHLLMMKRVVLMISKFIYNVHLILFST